MFRGGAKHAIIPFNLKAVLRAQQALHNNKYEFSAIDQVFSGLFTLPEDIEVISITPHDSPVTATGLYGHGKPYNNLIFQKITNKPNQFSLNFGCSNVPVDAFEGNLFWVSDLELKGNLSNISEITFVWQSLMAGREPLTEDSGYAGKTHIGYFINNESLSRSNQLVTSKPYPDYEDYLNSVYPVPYQPFNILPEPISGKLTGLAIAVNINPTSIYHADEGWIG